MQEIARYQRKTLIKDHPPVLQRKLIASAGAARDLLPGTVLGFKDGKHHPFTADTEASCILAEDVLVPVSGDAYALAYVHADVIASELIWESGTSAADQQTALEALRGKGIYVSEA